MFLVRLASCAPQWSSDGSLEKGLSMEGNNVVVVRF